MDKELLTKQIGPEATLKIMAIDNEKVRIEVSYDGVQADAGFYIVVEALEVLSVLVDSTATKWDNRVLELAKQFI